MSASAKAPTRDWKALPPNPEQIRHTANLIRCQMGKAAAVVTKRWAEEGDRNGRTHIGNGVTCWDVHREIVQLDGAGVKPVRSEGIARWTTKQIFGGAA